MPPVVEGISQIEKTSHLHQYTHNMAASVSAHAPRPVFVCAAKGARSGETN